jgi:hypothetical protein
VPRVAFLGALAATQRTTHNAQRTTLHLARRFTTKHAASRQSTQDENTAQAHSAGAHRPVATTRVVGCENVLAEALSSGLSSSDSEDSEMRGCPSLVLQALYAGLARLSRGILSKPAGGEPFPDDVDTRVGSQICGMAGSVLPTVLAAQAKT